jgi:hypothetical protein
VTHPRSGLRAAIDIEDLIGPTREVCRPLTLGRPEADRQGVSLQLVNAWAELGCTLAFIHEVGRTRSRLPPSSPSVFHSKTNATGPSGTSPLGRSVAFLTTILMVVGALMPSVETLTHGP